MPALAVLSTVQVLAAVDFEAASNDSTVANRNVLVFSMVDDLFLAFLMKNEIAFELAEEIIEAAVEGGGPIWLHETALALRS